MARKVTQLRTLTRVNVLRDAVSQHCTRTTRFRILKVEFIVTAFKLSHAEPEYL